MRLIDADAFKEYVCNAYEQVKHMYPDGGEWARQITEDFCKDIDEQPTIDISNNSNTLGALDCVDRQKAIDAVKFGITYAKAFNKSTGEVKELFREGNKALNEAVERLKELPPAEQPKERCIATITLSEEDLERIVKEQVEEIKDSLPRNGKWIDYSDEGYVECPFCHSATNCDGNKDELHYCFSCGAELRGE